MSTLSGKTVFDDFQFHTRTKTGRTQRLHDAMPSNYVQLSEKDAAKLGIQQGDLVDVRSRRGAVRLEAKVGEVDDGQVFIPFHFGSYDNKDAVAQAANELTKCVPARIDPQCRTHHGC
jgi:ferredoxin-nitrate reductase